MVVVHLLKLTVAKCSPLCVCIDQLKDCLNVLISCLFIVPPFFIFLFRLFGLCGQSMPIHPSIHA